MLGFCLKHFVRGCCAATALGAGVWSAPAQSTAPSGTAPALVSGHPGGIGQPLPGIQPDTHKDRLSSAAQIRAPHSLLGGDGLDDSSPMPEAPANALEELLNRQPQKNWTEMTPEEIFGLPAPDKPTDAKTLKDKGRGGDSLPVESYLLQQRLAQTSLDNHLNSDQGWGHLENGPGLANKHLEALRNGSLVRSQTFGHQLENGQDNNGFSPNQDDGWLHGFVSPRQALPSAAQVADMEAFNELIHPPEPTAEMRNAALGGKYFAPATSQSDPNLQARPAGYNPAGASYVPLQSGVGLPKRLAPLPSITSGLSTPTVTPSWAPKPPPWTSDTPQLFVNPVRKW